MTRHVILASLFSIAGCSASLLPVADCDNHVQCRDAFGYGSMCGDAGLCETVVMHERCANSWPEELVLPVSQDTTFMMGSLFTDDAGDEARRLSGELAVRQANEELSTGADIQFAMLHCDYTPTNPDDDGTETSEIVVELSRFMAEQVGINVFIGPPSSGYTTVAYNTVAEQTDTLIVSPSATSTALINIDGLTTSDDDPGLLWRTAAPDSGQGLAIYVDMTTVFDDDPLDGQSEFRTKPTNNLAIIHQTGSYGESLNDIVAGLFLENGANVTSFPWAGADEIPGVVSQVTPDFDEILFISSESPRYADFLSAVDSLPELHDKPLFLTDGGFGFEIFESEATAIYPNVRGTAAATPAGTVYNTFASLYDFRYNEDPNDYGYTANTWDATWIAMYSYFWARHQEEGISGVNMARGMRQMSTGPEVDVIPISLPGIISAFEGRDSVNLNGASGTLDFNPTTGEIAASTLIWEITGNGEGLTSLYVVNE